MFRRISNTFNTIKLCVRVLKKDKELITTACNFIGLLNDSKEEWNTLKKKNLKLSEKDIL